MLLTDEFESERYIEAPFLRLVDAFILQSIGFLDPLVEAKLNKMSPRINALYGIRGTWEEVVMKKTGFTQTSRGDIYQLWRNYGYIAYRCGNQLSPVAFTKIIVDQNVNYQSEKWFPVEEVLVEG